MGCCTNSARTAEAISSSQPREPFQENSKQESEEAPEAVPSQKSEVHHSCSSEPDVEEEEDEIVASDSGAPKPETRTYAKVPNMKRLGKGGSAEVWVGYCEQDPTVPLAIKEVFVKDKQTREMLSREYQTLLNLPASPYVVKVHHFDCCGTTGRIVLELCKGGSLRSVARKMPHKRIHEQALRCCLRDALRGLDHLHTNGILHRDFKSDNVLTVSRLPSAGKAAAFNTPLVKLSDFGSCKELLYGSVAPTTANVVGTVPYMAPEAITGKFSCASDVWAFGITFVELATPDQKLWEHLNCKDLFPLLLKIGSLRPPNHMPTLPVETLSPTAIEVIKACLAFDPSQRPSCASLLSMRYFADLEWIPEGMEPLEE